MSNKKYGVGIIGAGWVAGEYVKAFRDHPLTEVVGIYNKTPEKATRLMQSLNVAGKEHATIDDFFNDDRINIIVSCTHPDVRAEHAVRAAETGRHIVLEKPVGLSLKDTAQIRDAVAKAGVKTVSSFVLRWNPQFETVKQLIKEGILGDLIYAEADYWHPMKKIYPGYPYYITKKHGGSSFVVAGCHAVDIVRFLGGEIVEVTAFSAGPKLNMDFEYDPVAVASVRFANGAVGKISSVIDGETPYIFNCQLFGTEGSIRNNEVHSYKHYPGSLGYWSFPTIKPDSGDVSHHPFIPEIAHFMECIESNVESHASIYDSFKSMAVCYAIDESIAKGGQPVKVQLD
jgi:predicted dehydrogenase